VLAGALTVGLSACGSQLSPDDVYDLSARSTYGTASSPQPDGQPTNALPATDNGSQPDGEAPTAGGNQVPSGAPGSASGPGGSSAPDCAQFSNQTGITDSTITIGNAADISGPIPGVFESAQLGVKSYVAYFNATSTLCGRKLNLKTYDTRTDGGADQQAYVEMCDSAFASVGSMSVYDSGGAEATESCGLPDIRTAATSAARNACDTCFGTQALGNGEFSNPPADFLVKYYPEAARNAALLYINVGAAVEQAHVFMNVSAKRGVHYVYSDAIDVAEFNYSPYVERMEDAGVRSVQFIGAAQQTARLAQAMRDGGFAPDIFLMDPSVYDPIYVSNGGASVEGTVMFGPFRPFEDPVAEQTLYVQWLQQVDPDATPSFFGVFAWSAAKLFVEQARGLGGDLNRRTLVERIRRVNDWTGGGLHAPMQVGDKHAPGCDRFMRLQQGKWIPFHGRDYLCTGYSKG
jgi:ABC-type branched-subunit amino acid transport system substrate-binding protein